MATRLGLFIGTILIAIPLHQSRPAELIIWNVGQGLWATVVTEEECWHFDAGGEFAPWKSILTLCRRKQGFVSISHWDWDHMSFLRGFPNRLPSTCRMNTPLGPASPTKSMVIRRIPKCKTSPPYRYWENPNAKTTNGKSRVIFWKGAVFPGDSPRAQEKYWANELAGLATARILILGHHGSRTSTSNGLLRHFVGLKLAIISSRFRRYGHPHPDVLNALDRFHVPAVSTEDWGNIHVELP